MKFQELNQTVVNGEVRSTYEVGNLTVPNGTLSADEIYRSILRDYPDVMSVPQVSAALGISTKTVYRLLREGSLSSRKVGRAFKVPKLYVLQYLKVLGQH